MHVLITSDTVGGVWTYTQELVTGLIRCGHRVTLVSFGKLPAPHQTAWMRDLHALDYRPTEYRLEWMEVADRDIEESRRYLELLARETQPDILHFSQYGYGDIDFAAPKVVVAHSDVVSWWVAVHGKQPDDTPWMRRYRELVTRGLDGADMICAPSQWMLDEIRRHYPCSSPGRVVHNGRTAALFDPSAAKHDFVLSVGRIWDAAKDVRLLLDCETPSPVKIVGWEQEPGKGSATTALNPPPNVELLGPKSQAELHQLYAGAAIYAGTSRYEPFGLSPLEAALSGCALVLNDNPVFRELWDGAAVFFQRDDPASLAAAIESLRTDPSLRSDYAQRAHSRAVEKFSSELMVTEYEQLYQNAGAAVKMA